MDKTFKLAKFFLHRIFPGKYMETSNAMAALFKKPNETSSAKEARSLAASTPASSKVRLGFVIVAHDQPENTARLVTRLLEQDSVVALHWDARHPEDLPNRLIRDLPEEMGRRLIPTHRVAVHWGLWSVVEATLCGLRAIEKSCLEVSHVTLLSGHDYPLRPLSELRDFLSKHSEIEHIECVDHEKEKWVTDGLHDERWQYRHYVSWGTHPWVFDRIWKIQRFFGWKVRLPRGIKPHFGSQWWTLTWSTIARILLASREPRVRRFFRRTWVPDEMFFQTMVAKFVPPERISGKNLNFYHFDKQGVPLVFYNDHLNFLREQPHFFARKISPRASSLRDDLDDLARIREKSHTIPVKIAKKLANYEFFEAQQYRGVPNRRVIGSQRDLWWGDMECNKRSYTAIIAPENISLEPLWGQYASRRDTICYADLFHPEFIDYGGHADPHPLYPADAPMLRDLKKPNFLFDIIQQHPDKHMVFSIRVPSHTEIPGLVITDLHCNLVFVMPDQRFFYSVSQKSLNWQATFDEMVMADLYWQARKTGKQILVLSASHQVMGSNIESFGAFVEPMDRAPQTRHSYPDQLGPSLQPR